VSGVSQPGFSRYCEGVSLYNRGSPEGLCVGVKSSVDFCRGGISEPYPGWLKVGNGSLGRRRSFENISNTFHFTPYMVSVR
jgi:hypothetical protein